jgi:threonine dehydratase
MPIESQAEATVTLTQVVEAREQIAGEIVRTPLLFSEAATETAGLPVYSKLECLQHAGAFKTRGALNKIASLPVTARQRGLICASTGNHGLAVTYASKRLGLPCVVVLPENSNPHKTALLRKLGAQVITHGVGSDVRQRKVEELSSAEGYAQVPPFSDPMVIAGQGTTGLEVLEDLPDVDEVYAPIGGGGLIAGVAVAIKEQKPETRIYGVEPEHSDAMAEALRHQGPTPLTNVETIADGLAATITEELNYSIVSRYVEDVILVSDRAILESTLFLIESVKVLVEPSGAASFAGLMANPRRHGKAVCILSGGNVTLQQIGDLRGRFGL